MVWYKEDLYDAIEKLEKVPEEVMIDNMIVESLLTQEELIGNC